MFDTMVKKQEEIENQKTRILFLEKTISESLNLLHTAEDKTEYKQSELGEAINKLQTTLNTKTS